MFKTNKTEIAFAKTATGMEKELHRETSFGEENNEIFSMKIPPPPPYDIPPLERMNQIIREEDKEAYKQKLRDRVHNQIKMDEKEEAKQKKEEAKQKKEEDKTKKRRKTKQKKEEDKK